jgi:protein-S-isoprenylcysteine O-methyltransferase Ste14
MSSLNARAARATIIGAVVMAALLFGAAGTLRYWQAWLFMAGFQGASIAIGIYLAINDPALLARRMNVGPAAEKEPAQKIIMALAFAGMLALLIVPALDHRFGWSAVPPIVSLAGNILIGLGFLLMFFVFRENSYGASTIQVAAGQTLASTGPYARVRHPMYAGAIVMLIGVPLALGSWWGLAVVVLVVPVLAWRLLDEERVLARDLPGYAEYMGKVRYRLVPYVW